MSQSLKPAIPGIIWPAILPNEAAQVMAMQFQLDKSQWWPSEALRSHQLRQLRIVLAHASQNIPYYRDLIHEAGVRPELSDDWESWDQIPILGRTDVQQAGDALHCKRMPEGHGKIGQIKTTGSTGRPVVIRTTEVTQFFWRAFTLRDHMWQRRKLSGKLAVIRHNDDKDFALPPDGASRMGWGPSTDIIYPTGPLVSLNIRSTIKEQAAWLRREDPDYLLTYPTLALALAKHFIASGETLPNLKQVRTLGEIVTPPIRQACKEAWGATLVDMYTTQELGYMALQCPEHAHYHIQSENVFLEVLDEANKPCGPGESGRVVASTLNNFATPLIRYDIGDYATVGAQCPCGRGLPVLERINGRTRNMLHLPGGEVRWPVIGEKVQGLDNLPALRQYQVVQKSLELVEVRLVMPRHLTADEKETFVSMLQRTLGHPFEIRIVYPDSIERSAGGKYEEFLSEVS